MSAPDNDQDEPEGLLPDVKDSAGFSYFDPFYDPWAD